MASRLIRDGLVESEPFNSISWQAQALFLRLMLKADDFGRYTAEPRLVRAAVFPIQLDHVSDLDVKTWIEECEEAALIVTYTVKDKRFLEIPRFDQRLRAKRSKFPAPNRHDSAVNCPHIADKCPQVADTCPHVADKCPPVADKCPPEVEVEVEVEEGGVGGVPEKPAPLTLVAPDPPSARKRASVDEGFEKFWAVYPVKAGKANAHRVWKGLSEADKALATEKAAVYARLTAGATAIKYAQGWLNGRRWEDDPETWKRLGRPLDGARPASPPPLVYDPVANEARRREALGLDP